MDGAGTLTVCERERAQHVVDVYVLKRRWFEGGPAAQARAVWHTVVRRHRYEICHLCGRPVSRSCPTYWTAPDELWLEVYGQDGGIRCIPCFTADCAERGMTVRWGPVVDHRRSVPLSKKQASQEADAA